MTVTPFGVPEQDLWDVQTWSFILHQPCRWSVLEEL